MRRKMAAGFMMTKKFSAEQNKLVQLHQEEKDGGEEEDREIKSFSPFERL